MPWMGDSREGQAAATPATRSLRRCRTLVRRGQRLRLLITAAERRACSSIGPARRQKWNASGAKKPIPDSASPPAARARLTNSSQDALVMIVAEAITMATCSSAAAYS